MRREGGGVAIVVLLVGRGDADFGSVDLHSVYLETGLRWWCSPILKR